MVDYFNIHDLKDDLKKLAIRSGGVTCFARSINFVIQTVTTVILARALSPEEFGLVAMVTALGGFLAIFVDLGLTDATIQTAEINHRQINALFWINVTVTLVMVVIVIVLSPLVAWLYSEPRLVGITIIWSTYLFIASLSTQQIALLKRRMLFFKISINEITATLISNLSAIILALYGWGYWALVFRELILSTCMTTGAWLLCHWRPGRPSYRSDIQSMLKFGRDATGSFITGYFARNLDKILVGWRYGPTQLGYYHRAYYLFVLPTTQLTEALKNVATSTLSKLRSQPGEYEKYYLRAISVISFIGMPISFFLMIESEDLILLLLGPQWEQTIKIFQILAAGTGVWMIYSTNYWLHASLGRSDRLIRWGLFHLGLTAVAILTGLSFGPRGVALAYTCMLYLLTALGLKYAGAPIGIKLRTIVSSTSKYFVAALFAGLLCWYILQLVGIHWPRFARITICSFLYSALYLTVVVVCFKKKQPIMDMLSVIKELFVRSVIGNPTS